MEDGTHFFRDGDTLTIREPSGKVTVRQVSPRHTRLIGKIDTMIILHNMIT